MKNETDRVVDSFEKASQEMFKETWEFSWSVIGLASLMVVTFFGIYFSQVALAAVMGVVGLMLYFTWAASIAISALEVAGIKLLGNKERSTAISQSNLAEHRIAKLFTWGLFGFDIFTNWAGLFITAVSFMPVGKSVELGGWVIIIFFGSLMAISEVLVGWMLRSVATSYVSFLGARQKFNCYKERMEKAMNTETRPTQSQDGQENATRKQDHRMSRDPRGQEETFGKVNMRPATFEREEPNYHPIGRTSRGTENRSE